MKSLSFEPEASELVEVNWADRWQVHRRLQELEIPCWCGTDQPLRVHVAGFAAAVQLWSVTRQLTETRQDLVCWLERCYRIKL